MVVVTSDLAAAAVPLVLISRAFLKIFASFLKLGKENWNRSATFFDLSKLCLCYHLSYYLTEILMV